MADWTIHLEFKQGSSNKFWRGRVEGSDVTTNWGRAGAAGQSKTKSLASPDAARADLDKQAAGKRKKGYVDADCAPVVEEAAPPPPKEETWTAEMKLAEEGRRIALTLACDGKVIRTSVEETYDSDDSAAAAYTRIKQKLVSDGYEG